MTKPALYADSELGTSWSLTDAILTNTPQGGVLQGKLVSPRGGSDGKTVAVPAMEWSCNP